MAARHLPPDPLILLQLTQVLGGKQIAEAHGLPIGCGFRRLRPLIPNEGGHLFQSKAARVSEDPGRVVSSSADG